MKKIRKKIISFIEAIDVFSISPAFLLTFKNKFQYSTISTKVMTLLITFLSLSSFFYFADNFINQTNPLNVLTEEKSLNPKKVQMNTNSFFFTFALENSTDNYRPFIDESIYKIEAMLETRENEILARSKLLIGKCELQDIPSQNRDLQKYFEKKLYKMYCFKNTSEAFINGTWDSEIFQGIRLKVSPCINKTSSIPCKSQEIIDDYLQGRYFLMHYTSVQTDLNSYKNPINIAAVDDFRPTSLKMSSQIYLYFGPVKIETDNGLFSENIVSDEGINLISQSLIPTETPNDLTILTIYLRLDGLSKTTKRKYDKVLDVLSKVGGLMRVLTLLGVVLLKPFLEEAMLQRVSNETFDYKELLKDDDKNSIKSRKIKLSLWEYIRNKVKKKKNLSRKSKIMRKSVKMMKKYLDISGVINRMFDIEKMKSTINNHEFHRMRSQKPQIILDEIDLKNAVHLNQQEKTFFQRFFMPNSKKKVEKKKQDFNEKKSRNFKEKIKNFDLVSSKSLYFKKEDFFNKKSKKLFFSLESPQNSNSEIKKLKEIEPQSSENGISDERAYKEINISQQPAFFHLKNFE